MIYVIINVNSFWRTLSLSRKEDCKKMRDLSIVILFVVSISGRVEGWREQLLLQGPPTLLCVEFKILSKLLTVAFATGIRNGGPVE